MNYNQSEIILLRFPFSDLSSTKKRPALILSSNTFNQSHEDVICCLITTNLEHDEYGIIIESKDMTIGSLPFKSKIKPYRLFSAQQKIIEKKIGMLSRAKYEQTITTLNRIMQVNH